MKVGDLVEWKGHKTTATWAIYKAGGIGVVADMTPHPGRLSRANEYYRVLFPAPAGEMVVRACFLKVLS